MGHLQSHPHKAASFPQAGKVVLTSKTHRLRFKDRNLKTTSWLCWGLGPRSVWLGSSCRIHYLHLTGG